MIYDHMEFALRKFFKDASNKFSLLFFQIIFFISVVKLKLFVATGFLLSYLFGSMNDEVIK